MVGCDAEVVREQLQSSASATFAGQFGRFSWTVLGIGEGALAIHELFRAVLGSVGKIVGSILWRSWPAGRSSNRASSGDQRPADVQTVWRTEA